MSKPNQLNPQVESVLIGIRELREIKIYPLSLAEQLKLSEIIAKAASSYVNSQDQSDMAFAAFLTETISENIVKILSLVTDEKGEDLLNEITNNQAANIATILYEMNYGSVIKKVMALIAKAKKIA